MTVLQTRVVVCGSVRLVLRERQKPVFIGQIGVLAVLRVVHTLDGEQRLARVEQVVFPASVAGSIQFDICV